MDIIEKFGAVNPEIWHFEFGVLKSKVKLQVIFLCTVLGWNKAYFK